MATNYSDDFEEYAKNYDKLDVAKNATTQTSSNDDDLEEYARNYDKPKQVQQEQPEEGTVKQFLNMYLMGKLPEQGMQTIKGLGNFVGDIGKDIALGGIHFGQGLNKAVLGNLLGRDLSKTGANIDFDKELGMQDAGLLDKLVQGGVEMTPAIFGAGALGVGEKAGSLVKNPLLQKLVSGITEGATAGGLYGTTAEAGQDNYLPNVLKDIGEFGAFGTIPAIAKAGKRAFEEIKTVPDILKKPKELKSELRDITSQKEEEINKFKEEKQLEQNTLEKNINDLIGENKNNEFNLLKTLNPEHGLEDSLKDNVVINREKAGNIAYNKYKEYKKIQDDLYTDIGKKAEQIKVPYTEEELKNLKGKTSSNLSDLLQEKRKVNADYYDIYNKPIKDAQDYEKLQSHGDKINSLDSKIQESIVNHPDKEFANDLQNSLDYANEFHKNYIRPFKDHNNSNVRQFFASGGENHNKLLDNINNLDPESTELKSLLGDEFKNRNLYDVLYDRIVDRDFKNLARNLFGKEIKESDLSPFRKFVEDIKQQENKILSKKEELKKVDISNKAELEKKKEELKQLINEKQEELKLSEEAKNSLKTKLKAGAYTGLKFAGLGLSPFMIYKLTQAIGL